MARESQTALTLWHNEKHVHDSGGERLSAQRGDRVLHLMQGVFDEAFAHSASHRGSSAIPADRSVYDFVAERAAELAVREGEDLGLLMHVADTWSGYVGQSIRKQGLRFAYLDQCCSEGKLRVVFPMSYKTLMEVVVGQYFIESTYEAILERVAKLPRQLADLRLKQKVAAITTGDGSCGGVTVKTESGESLSFDEVVVTAPLGWLKKNTHIFSPSLPPRLSRAIDSIGVANFEKVRSSKDIFLATRENC